MAVSVRAERFASSAQTSRVAAACTLLREQPDTPGPQPRLGSKAAAVPSTLNSEFSSKSLLNSPEVSACAVLLGVLSLLTLDAQKPKSLRGSVAVCIGAACQQAAQKSSTHKERKDVLLSHRGCPPSICARPAGRGKYLSETSILFCRAVVNRPCHEQILRGRAVGPD